MVKILNRKNMKKAVKKVSLIKRIKSPSPLFFVKVKKIGLLLSGVGAAVFASPIALPVIMTTLAGYLVTAGLVAAAVAVGTIEEKPIKA
jgi:hypothetical protein